VGAAAVIAGTPKTAKYTDLTTQFAFEQIAVETQGLLNESARDLLSDVGRWISMSSGDDREVRFLFQRDSVVMQRFNSVMLHDSSCVEDQPD